jgi:hypothetical protein
MGAQIVIFLAFVSVTLVFNAVVIWLAYKAFADITLRVTGTMSQIHASEATQRWMGALESASVQAIAITDMTRERINSFEPVLARAESKYGYGLAKVDIRVEDFCENVRTYMQSAQRRVEDPCHQIGSAMLVVRDLLERFSGVLPEKSDDSATATPSK